MTDGPFHITEKCSCQGLWHFSWTIARQLQVFHDDMISVYEFVKRITNCKTSFTNPVKTRKDMLLFSFESFKNIVIFYRVPRVTTKLVIEATLLGFWPRLSRWRSWYWRNWSRMRRRHFGSSGQGKSGTNIFQISSQSSRTITQNLYQSYLLIEIKVNIVFVSLAIV